MLKERNTNSSDGGYTHQEVRDADLRRALAEHGIASEHINEVLAQLNVLAAAPANDAATENGSNGSGAYSSNANGSGNGVAANGAALSENARIIMQQRYLMKGDDGKPVEDPDGLFHRVANAVAQGEEPGERPLWGGKFHDLMASLKFLPNSPTLVNAGTGGRGCLSACFVVSPDDNMNSIMQVASDAAMIEKWGGGIGFGFSRLRPRRDRIATTHGEACGPIAVMKLYSSVGATLTQGAFRLGAHMGQLSITHPDVREFIHCKDNDDTLQNFNISVQITDDFMRAVNNDEDWSFYNPRDTGDGPVNEVADTVRARDLWREICESAWKTGDPGVVFIDRVWDTQPNPQMGDIQTSNPCGEEFLENYGNCCLGSINLDKHVTAGGFDYDSLEDTVRTAVRFLDDVIEVNQFPMPKLREVNLATRRIGLGVMGWADALIRMGVPYDSPRALQLTEEVAGFMNKTAWDESARLAAERGPFPEYEDSALKTRGLPPVRNSSVITIAPTGTISRLADCSSGIEPHFANAWWSNVLWKGSDGAGEAAERLLDAPKSVWEALRERLDDEDQVRAVLEQLADAPADAERIFTENGIDPAHFRTSMLISPEAHVRMQAAWQKYVTNSVSKTINLPNSATIEDVEEAYYLAWQTECKAVTVYRDGSKSMQVLETGKDSDTADDAVAEDANMDKNGFLVPRERPTAVLGITERVRTGHGTMYVTVNFDNDNKPFELFTAIGKAGGSEPAHLEGLSRMVTLCLRSGIDPNAIIYHLSGITSEPMWDNGVLIRSAEDGVAHVLKKHLNGPNNPGESGAKSDGAAQLGLFTTPKFAESGAAYAPSAGQADAAQPSGDYQRMHLRADCATCPGRVIHQEGCLRCLDCGYTKCE
ncbi:MAG: adenosylcobalamin-dependent ribonucleoside-diphosphate reductase [Chloroflexota bacterium]|nr:adenosylcobalamin-dependent ribonucleoside-diphosphate reductase [Chloroflexota bacterium]